MERGEISEVSATITFLDHESGTSMEANKFTDLRRQRWKPDDAKVASVYRAEEWIGESIHGIFQARVLEWGAIFFSRGSSQPRDQTWISCIAGRFFT